MLEEKVKSTIKKYDLIKNGDNIVVGVSGGPDSMTLLNVLINLKENLNLKITVAHINHMIRQEAEEETKYVQNFCKQRDIECFVKREKVEELAKNNKIGTEEAGRKLRYSFFEEVLEKVNANKIATAHTANDNSETVLMNIDTNQFIENNIKMPRNFMTLVYSVIMQMKHFVKIIHKKII